MVSNRAKPRHRWASALDSADVSVGIAGSLTEVARHEDVSLVVLDCPSDPEDAVRQCARARAIQTNVRLVILAKYQGSLTRARLFETGADSILLHPFATRELVACVHAMLRAASVPSRAAVEGKAREPVTQTTDLTRELSLTETERLLLECLGSGPIVTRTQILETVFAGTHYRADSSHLRVHLHRLRAKLRSAHLTVKTVYGRGYQLLPL